MVYIILFFLGLLPPSLFDFLLLLIMSHGDDLANESKFNTRGIDYYENNESTLMSRSENNSASSNSSLETKHHVNNSTNNLPSPNNSLNKTSHRTKLSTQDIRLILYLIVRIKPFKYVGDRKISQTRKWELIQSRYEEIKRSETTLLVNDQDEIIVPTVRTLQRQLANAIKKAKLRSGGSFSSTPGKYLFNSITRKSSTSELEMALLELFESSEKLKNGKTSSSSNVNLVSGSDQFIHSGIPNYSQDFRIGSSSDRKGDEEEGEMSLEMDIESKIDGLNNHDQFISSNIDIEIVLKNIHDVRKSILEQLNQNNSNSLPKILSLLQDLITQGAKYESEQEKLFNHNMRIISQQYKTFKRFVELNKSLVSREDQLDKEVLSKIISEFSKDEVIPVSTAPLDESNPVAMSVDGSSDKPKETSTNKNRILKSLQELLN